MLLRIRLLSNWGDRHYIGLNGLELFDRDSAPLLNRKDAEFQLVADPSSVASSYSGK